MHILFNMIFYLFAIKLESVSLNTWYLFLRYFSYIKKCALIFVRATVLVNIKGKAFASFLKKIPNWIKLSLSDRDAHKLGFNEGIIKWSKEYLFFYLVTFSCKIAAMCPLLNWSPNISPLACTQWGAIIHTFLDGVSQDSSLKYIVLHKNLSIREHFEKQWVLPKEFRWNHWCGLQEEESPYLNTKGMLLCKLLAIPAWVWYPN
jgi:hypothetical protein